MNLLVRSLSDEDDGLSLQVTNCHIIIIIVIIIIIMIMIIISVSARRIRQNESSRYCRDVRLSVCLSGMGMHCDHTVHVSTDSSL